MNTGDIKLVLFDIDDTLYDFEQNWQEAVALTFAAHDLTREIDQQKVCETFNYYSELYWDKIVSNELTFQNYRHLRLKDTLLKFGKALSDEHFDSFSRLFVDTSLALLRRDEEVIRVLRRLSERFALGVITNGANDTAREKLTCLGLKEFFPDEAVIVSSDVGTAKPDRAIFQLTLDRLGFSAAEAVFVGDSWPADIVGAIDAGLAAVWFNPKQAVRLTAHMPIAEITRLSELEPLLLGDVPPSAEIMMKESDFGV